MASTSYPLYTIAQFSATRRIPQNPCGNANSSLTTEPLNLSQSPQPFKLHTLKLSKPLVLYAVAVSKDEILAQTPEDVSNSHKVSNESLAILPAESTRRVFVQDPPWISSLFLNNNLFVRAREIERVKLRIRETNRNKYRLLKRRQVKAETEAWEKEVEEYRELQREMCEKKLAPNLPYVKKLFLGWFEPLRDAIEKEQKTQRSKKHRAAYSPYIDSLPADKMAVIVMHQIMGLMMMCGNENKYVQVVQAALQIGTAIENEVSISFLYFLVLC